MLVLSRKLQETIVLDGRISITVVEVRGNQVRLGIEAPADVKIKRQELLAHCDRLDAPGPSGEHTAHLESLACR